MIKSTTARLLFKTPRPDVQTNDPYRRSCIVIFSSSAKAQSSILDSGVELRSAAAAARQELTYSSIHCVQIVLSQTDSRHASDGDERLEILRVIFVTLGGCDCRICFLVHLWWCRHSLNLVQDHVAGAGSRNGARRRRMAGRTGQSSRSLSWFWWLLIEIRDT